MTTPVLEAKDITVQFGHGSGLVAAVDDVSVEVAKDESIGIVGESGSGKTTLARVLTGLQKANLGTVHLNGVDVCSGKKPYHGAVRRQVQMVSQDPYSCLNPHMTAVESVAEAMRVWHGWGRSKSTQKALELMQSLGIGAKDARKHPSSMSGGQRQRVNMARALAPGPTVLIADEPTSSIDQSAQAQLLNLLQEIRVRDGLSLIFVSHDLEIIRYLTTRVYVMRRGVVVESGVTSELFNSPQHEYTQRLLSSIPGARRRAASAS